MTNEEYYIHYRLGYFKKSLKLQKCHGGEIAGTDCKRYIIPGEVFLKTGVHDLDGVSLLLCQECAKKEI